jgi:hypothetical protein
MGDPFADSSDVAARWRPLTSAEIGQADVLCADASALIRARFPGIDSQVTSGQVDSGVLTMVVAGMVRRAMIAPAEGVSSQSETAGPFARSQTFANPLGNVFLTAADLTLILGYQPRASSHKFGNDTCRVENTGPGFVYGVWP